MAVIQAPPHGPGTARRGWLAVVLAVIITGLLAAVVVLLVHDQAPLGSRVRGSGLAATQARSLPAFSKVELAGSNNVIVTVGGRQSVTVHADSNLLRSVTTTVSSQTLVIGTTGSFTTESPMSVVVTVPSLTAATLSGSGTIAISGVHTAQLTLTLPGSGILRASGTVTRLDVTLSGSGEALLTDLAASHVRATVAGSGMINVTATRSLYAEITGSGTISYRGNPPQLTTNVTGSGTVLRAS